MKMTIRTLQEALKTKIEGEVLGKLKSLFVLLPRQAPQTVRTDRHKELTRVGANVFVVDTTPVDMFPIM